MTVTLTPAVKFPPHLTAIGFVADFSSKSKVPKVLTLSANGDNYGAGQKPVL
jgi:hypothetical protein